jgi:hypothetical protein
MPVTKTLLAPNKCRKWGVVILDARPPFYVNQNRKWQILLGPDSAFTASVLSLKVAAEFNTVDFANIRLTGYLYSPAAGTISSMGSCVFNIYKVTTPNWTEQLITSVAGTDTPNSYFFAEIPTSVFIPSEMDGGPTLMVEAVSTRLGDTYRERVYVNHLGVYDSIVRLRQDVDYLDITKQDE